MDSRRIFQTALRALRKMDRAVAILPLWLKIVIGLALAAEFIVVTQWEHLPFRQTPTATPITIARAAPPATGKHPDTRPTPAIDHARVARIEPGPARRMDRVEIDNPQAQPDGAIVGSGQTFYLYGIKPFNSKLLCMKSSGERWACGLHAYATLRNDIAHKTLTCDPKTTSPKGTSAICRIGTTNVALALLRDGVVELEENIDDAAMVNAQAFAKIRRLGVWDR
jgi:endonuclease YncB( thermonuclease family)